MALPQLHRDAKIFHRRIQVFFDHAFEGVDFVDEQNGAARHVGQQPGQIAWLIQHRPGGFDQLTAHFSGHDVRQGRFADAGRPAEQDMVQDIVAALCATAMPRTDYQSLALTGEVAEPLRPQGAIAGIIHRSKSRGAAMRAVHRGCSCKVTATRRARMRVWQITRCDVARQAPASTVRA